MDACEKCEFIYVKSTTLTLTAINIVESFPSTLSPTLDYKVWHTC